MTIKENTSYFGRLIRKKPKEINPGSIIEGVNVLGSTTPTNMLVVNKDTIVGVDSLKLGEKVTYVEGEINRAHLGKGGWIRKTKITWSDETTEARQEKPTSRNPFLTKRSI